MTWTYTLALLPTSALMQVRLIIDDRDSTEQLLQDEEINWYLSQFPNIYKAAAGCAHTISGIYTHLATEEKVEQVKFNYTARAKLYMELKDQLIEQAKTAIAGQAYAGGISIADKEATELDTDRVQPAFYKDEFDNPDGAS